MDKVYSAGRSYCTFQRVIVILFAFCALSLFAWGFKKRNDISQYTKTANGTLSNIVVTQNTSGRETSYSMLGVASFTCNGNTVTKNITGTKASYQNNQSVTLLYNPKTCECVIKDEYLSPVKTASIAMGGACSCIACCITVFFILGTDWGCAFTVIGQVSDIL